jgi:hypothetical protein
MKLEITMLSEIVQWHKQVVHDFTHLQNLKQADLREVETRMVIIRGGGEGSSVEGWGKVEQWLLRKNQKGVESSVGLLHRSVTVCNSNVLYIF